MKKNRVAPLRRRPSGSILFILLLLFLQLSAIPAAWSQSVKISGMVKDEGGSPMKGATVTIKGSGNSTMTDSTGRYDLTLPGGKNILIFSYTGYEKTEVEIGHRTTFNVTMKVAAGNLNDVVVVGYGTQKKADLTGAVVAVTGAELNKRVATDPTSLLQGKLPGLSLVQGTGEAGNEGFVLRVRGLGTNSSAGSNPLIIVDGLPGSLSALDPQNIESVTLDRRAHV